MSSLRPAPSTAGRRGVTLIESMAATVVLLTGLVGALQATAMATRQESSAQRFTRAASLAYQVRSGLELQGSKLLVSSGGALAAGCSSAADVLELAFGLQSVSPADVPVAGCVIDLDAFEQTASDGLKVVPGYAPEDRAIFRRVLIHYPEMLGSVVVSNRVVVVVSWREFMGNRNRVVQHLTLVGPTKENGQYATF